MVMYQVPTANNAILCQYRHITNMKKSKHRCMIIEGKFLNEGLELRRQTVSLFFKECLKQALNPLNYQAHIS